MDEVDPDPRVFGRVINLFITHHSSSPNENQKILLNLLQGLVRNIKWSPEKVLVLFDALLQRLESVYSNDRSRLLTWLHQMLHCIQVNYITPTWRSKSGKTLLELVRDTAVTNEALKVCLADDEDKTLDEIIGEIRAGELNEVTEELLAEVRDIVSTVEAALTSRSSGSQLTGLKKDLMILCQAAEKAHFRPRVTQMVSWCLMALSKTGRLIQVGTGEGKSCIVAMFAAFRAMRGEKVDIMSSSSVLAERDMKEWKKFYDILKISVDCNINKEDTDLKKCHENQIVYGTVEQFAGDWLKHHVLRMDIFGQRTFQCAIVDEVDSLMLDKGHHAVYLSSDMSSLQHLNPLLALIWATANQYSKVGTGETVGPKYPFHQVALEQIKQEGIDQVTVLQIAEDTSVLAEGTVREIQRKPSLINEKTENVAADKLVDFFMTVEMRFPSCQFALHRKNPDGSVEALNRRPNRENGQRRVSLLLNGGFCQYMYPDENSVRRAAEREIRRALHFTPRDLNQDEGSCCIPGFLSELVESKLKVWIENAFRAKMMEIDHEYVLEGHVIVPVDYSCTDVVEDCMKWADGLQQFLEMKHQSKLSDMTVITNYMSNVCLLQKYKSQIYGLSGTLGQQAEIEALTKVYEGIQTCQIPSFKRRKLFEVQGVIVKDERKWIEKICEVVSEQIRPTPYRSSRAVLVICESIKLAKLLYQIFGGRVPNTTLYIKNDRGNNLVFSKKMGAGNVMIATNLAGRGTDLQISDSVKAAGGLFVVQTFLPDNARVEAQAFGHAARQGSPGSAQIIVCFSHLLEPLQLLIVTRNLLSFMGNIADFSAPFLRLFLQHLRHYQRSTASEDGQISSLLSRILTENSPADITMIKEIRDASVAEQLSSYVESEIKNIKKKEELFHQYLETLDLLYKSNNNKPTESDVSALHEFWGIWLLTKFTEEGSAVRLKEILKDDLTKAIRKLRQTEPPSSNPHYYTVHGSELQKMGKLSESIIMYTKAIDQDPCWAAVAYYNRAFASLTQQSRNQGECLSRALEDLQKAFMSVDLYCAQLDVTYRSVTQQTTAPADNSTTRFDKHVMARHRVMVSFKSNIYEAMQKVDRARDSGGSVRMKKSPVYQLVSFEHLLPLPVILMVSARGIYSRNPLLRYQLLSQPSLDIFNELMGLESLGLTHIYVLDTPFSLVAFFSNVARALH